MKTKLLLLLLAFALMSGTCSTEKSPTPANVCHCSKVYYDYGVTGMNGVSPVWGYTEVGRETATEMQCSLATGTYQQIDTNSYYKIECE